CFGVVGDRRQATRRTADANDVASARDIERRPEAAKSPADRGSHLPHRIVARIVCAFVLRLDVVRNDVHQHGVCARGDVRRRPAGGAERCRTEVDRQQQSREEPVYGRQRARRRRGGQLQRVHDASSSRRGDAVCRTRRWRTTCRRNMTRLAPKSTTVMPTSGTEKRAWTYSATTTGTIELAMTLSHGSRRGMVSS